MQEFQRIDLVLKDVGPASDNIEAIVRNGESSWDVFMIGEIELSLAYDDEQQTLVLSTTVGYPNPENLMDIFETLLRFNSLRSETGGVTMALANDFAVTQTMEINAAVVEQQLLITVLENFAEKITVWRDIILASPDESEASAQQCACGMRV